MASHVRGTVLLSSLRSLRKRDLLDRYMASLNVAYHPEVMSITAPTWYPIPLADAHYSACDALNLSAVVAQEIGTESSRFINESVVRTLARASREAGATPWSALSLIPRLMERTWQGGAIGIWRVGPKDARLEWHGQPVARHPYYRVALQGFTNALVTMFARTGVVRQIATRGPPSMVALRISWV